MHALSRPVSASPVPADETARLARLHQLALLDTAAEPLFDALTRVASAVTGMPIALISLLDTDRQWFKSNLGLKGVTQTPRDVAFCAHAIMDDAVMTVDDALADSRFANNPLVTGEPTIRFYAGAPLLMPGGHRLGTLCVIDRKPRHLSELQRALLADLAKATCEAILLRERTFLEAARARAQVEAELTGNVSVMNSVLDVLPLSISVWDHDLRNIYQNAIIERWFGRTADSIKGQPLAALIGDKAATGDSARHAAALAGSAQSFERLVPTPNGARDMHVQLLPYRSGSGSPDGMVALVTDIGDVRTAERALRASERQFRTLADSSPLGVFQTDAAGACVYTNARWQEIYGLSLAQSLGDGWSAGLHPQDRDEVVRQWQLAASSSGEFEMEFRVCRPGGEVRHVRSNARAVRDDDGQVVAYVGALADISARRQAERSLHERNQQLRLLYEKTPAMLHSIDAAGMLLSVSDLWLKLLGHTREAVIGRPWTEFLSEPSRQHLRETALPTLWQQGRVDRVPCRWMRRDGRALDALLSAICLGAANGAPQSSLAVIEDVSEVLARTAELQREYALRTQLERHANELQGLLAERSEMLDVLAHEVRQPLNNASAALQSAAAVLADKGDAATSLRLARAQGVIGVVQAGVDNILAAASLLAVDAKPVLADIDIDTLLALVIGDMPAADRGRVVVQRQSAARTAALDLALTRLALRNLLANALAFSALPGAAPRSGVAKPVLLRLADSEDPLGLTIDVIDQGPGVDAQVLPRLFERGVHGERPGDHASHGLGLYIARRALELQGGSVRLLHTGPAGTAMRLLLSQSED